MIEKKQNQPIVPLSAGAKHLRLDGEQRAQTERVTSVKMAA